ncbi:hypothetical protein [Rhodoplanes sp. Z2-YC6860]|uniref:hypothetical protein n=1 Tax=Rhodoplanes sp. Z2-YC6860 TaxID=674703 RepID=UPI00078DC9ED|nr:hypothetical protein [Rhodoplanes sp. Z2-YC6860]AMN43450.1 hypothetical protein RHPLAN_50260 [Rhodoplanes sp. Z2-YC6860]
MTALLLKAIDPSRWRRLGERYIAQWRQRRAADRLDRLLSGLEPARPAAAGEGTVVADGMWFNPNHFFRLRLFLEALAAKGENFRLLGILRKKSDIRALNALRRLGFSEFLFVEEDDEFCTEHFRKEADALLAKVRCYQDLLDIPLPEGVPAYTYYDTVLKLAAHPQPLLRDPIWSKTLAETLRNVAIYRRELDRRKIVHVVLSHPWKSEWATLLWLAIGRGIPSYHLTAFCEAIRIRRFRSRTDYATPVEHLPFDQFESLAPIVQQQLSEVGREDLARRVTGTSTDINARYAFNPAKRINDRNAARLMLSGQTARPVAVVYCHIWFDFPHTFGMKNFADMKDWMECTIEHIRTCDDVVWLLKPHPTENWYGGFSLADMAQDLPSHVRVLPLNTDSQTVMTAADAIVTVHGTIGLEAAAQGLTVVMGDRSYFSDWKIGYAAQSRDDYRRLLSSISRLPEPENIARERAMACFATALSKPPSFVDALEMSCDSSGLALYAEITDRLMSRPDECVREIERLAAFLKQSEIDSYAAFSLVNALSRKIPAKSAVA